MLRTVLLIDGSEAMNSSADYLPNYLLAMRPPLLRFVERYLDSTPLASLGIVVMRDGVSHRLLSCTTNQNEIVDVLERDVFLHGGSGSTSIENGLRMAMSELVDMRKVAALAASSAASALSTSAKGTRVTWKGSAAQLNVLLVSASVTLIDPTDIFSVVNTMTALTIRINVVSLVGAVHVFEVCAVETGGTLHCPLNYDHLLHIMDVVSTSHHAHAATRKRRRRTKRAKDADGLMDNDDDDEGADAPYLIPIGCPLYLEAPPLSGQQQAPPPSAESTGAQVNDVAAYYLACPQCHLIQLAVPTTCPMCRLLLCSVPMLYSTYVSHNSLVPAAHRRRVVRAKSEPKEGVSSGAVQPSASAKTSSVAEDEAVRVVRASPAQPVRCSLCLSSIPADTYVPSSAVEDAVLTAAATSPPPPSELAHVWQCSSCASYRCDACNKFVCDTIGLCPHCVALR